MRVPPSGEGCEPNSIRPANEASAQNTHAAHAAERTKAGEPAVVVSTRASETVARAEQEDSERATRIERIAAEIKNGTYRVDKDTLAVRLVDEEVARARRE